MTKPIARLGGEQFAAQDAREAAAVTTRNTRSTPSAFPVGGSGSEPAAVPGATRLGAMRAPKPAITTTEDDQ